MTNELPLTWQNSLAAFFQGYERNITVCSHGKAAHVSVVYVTFSKATGSLRDLDVKNRKKNLPDVSRQRPVKFLSFYREQNKTYMNTSF